MEAMSRMSTYKNDFLLPCKYSCGNVATLPPNGQILFEF